MLTSIFFWCCTIMVGKMLAIRPPAVTAFRVRQHLAVPLLPLLFKVRKQFWLTVLEIGPLSGIIDHVKKKFVLLNL